jgi:hypothetical protein
MNIETPPSYQWASLFELLKMATMQWLFFQLVDIVEPLEEQMHELVRMVLM